jgi:hypothetical protein
MARRSHAQLLSWGFEGLASIRAPERGTFPPLAVPASSRGNPVPTGSRVIPRATMRAPSAKMEATIADSIQLGRYAPAKAKSAMTERMGSDNGMVLLKHSLYL